MRNSLFNVLSVCIALLLLGVGLRMSLRLLYGARGPRSDDAFARAINFVGWALIILPLMVLLLTATNYLALIVFLVVLAALVEIVLARRDLQRRTVWWLLTATAGERQSQPEALMRHRERFTGTVGRAFRRLVYALIQGLDLHTAVSLNRSAVPREALAYTALDAAPTPDSISVSSQVAEPVDASAAVATMSTISTFWQQLYQHLIYLFTVLLVMTGILAFLMIKIVPSYQAIFDDFELELPSMTVALIAISSWFVNSGLGAMILWGAVLALLAGICVAFLYLCDIPVLQPIADRLFLTWHRSLVLQLLAVTAKRKRAFSLALSQLTRDESSYPSRFVRRRLERVKELVFAGSDWKEALNRYSFIRREDIPLLQTAEQAENVPWVLRLLAEQRERTMLFRWLAFEQIAFPITIVLLGMIVAFICIALFIPLVDLIYGLA